MTSIIIEAVAGYLVTGLIIAFINVGNRHHYKKWADTQPAEERERLSWDINYYGMWILTTALWPLVVAEGVYKRIARRK